VDLLQQSNQGDTNNVANPVKAEVESFSGKNSAGGWGSLESKTIEFRRQNMSKRLILTAAEAPAMTARRVAIEASIVMWRCRGE
jgi:hypothetical protein